MPPGNDARPGYSLSCGTLILIAIIVAVFSRGGADDIHALRNDIRFVEQKIDRMEVKRAAVDKAIPEQRNQ